MKLTRALSLSILFFLIEFILIHFHEVWSDEVHSWGIAISSHSFTELIYNKRWEGHPELWYVLLYVLQLFTHNIFYMQVLHTFIAACTVFVFCVFSPLPFWKNILICFGYFFAYEYSIISRNYSIELLLLFLCAGLYTTYRDRYLVLISLLFFLLFQTNVYAVIIGFPFYCYILWSLYMSHSLKQKTAIISGAILMLGIIVSVMTMKPPGDSIFNIWNTHINLFDCENVLSTIYTSYLPVPLITEHYWSTNILDIFSRHLIIEDILSLLIVLVVTLMFKSNKKILFLYFIGTIGVLLFTYVKNFGWIRHHGQLYILFVLCYYIFCAESQEVDTNLNNKTTFSLRKYIVPLIIFIQFISAVFANIGDVKYTFSNEQPVADYLKEKSLDTLPILGHEDYAVSGIAGIMDKDIYFIRSKYWGRYIILDSTWGFSPSLKEEDVLNAADKISEQKKTDIIVILDYPFNYTGLKNWALLKSFEGSVTGDSFFVYRVKYTPKI